MKRTKKQKEQGAINRLINSRVNRKQTTEANKDWLRSGGRALIAAWLPKQRNKRRKSASISLSFGAGEEIHTIIHRGKMKSRPPRYCGGTMWPCKVTAPFTANTDDRAWWCDRCGRMEPRKRVVMSADFPSEHPTSHVPGEW